jgi:hypothetical protein
MSRARFTLLSLSSLLAVVACSVMSTPTPQIVVQTVEVEVTRLVEVEITSTAQPTPSPTEPAPGILEADFDAGSGEWYVSSDSNGSSQVADGELLLTVEGANYEYGSGHPDLNFINAPFDITVAMSNKSGPRDAYGGIGFRYFDDANFAALYVNGDGFINLGFTLEGTYYIIIPWTRPVSVPRRPYIIHLVDSGTRVVAYLNDELVFDLPFEDLRTGGIYLFAGTFEGGPSTWSFDDLHVRQFTP